MSSNDGGKIFISSSNIHGQHVIVHNIFNTIINCYSVFHKIFAQKPDSILIILVIFVANYDNIRDKVNVGQSDTVLPDAPHSRRGISQSAIARIVNLPRETTRRRLAALIADDLITNNNGSLFVTEKAEILIMDSEFVPALLGEIAKGYKMLSDLGTVAQLVGKTISS